LADVIILSGTEYRPDHLAQVQRGLGAYRVASELKKQGYDAVVIDYIQYMSTEEIINAISKVLTKDTLWLGYSSSFFILRKNDGSPLSPVEKLYQSTPYRQITTIYDYVRANSKAKIVFGGAFSLISQADPEVDYYIVGYGDVSTVDLTHYLAGKKDKIEHYEEKDINGSKTIVIDSGKYPEPAMDTLQTVWYDDNVNLLPGEGVPLEFARGCIFKCKFCSYPLLGKKKGTYIRDMEEVRDEMLKLWETRGTEHFYITDDTFNDDNDKMEEFHKLFTSLPFKPKFSCFLRLDLIDRFPHQADLLLEAGLVGNFFGIETLNHKSGKAIGKGLHPERVKERLKWVRDKWKDKVNIGTAFIFGLPYDDEKYFQELWDYVHSPDYPAQNTTFNALFMTDKNKSTNPYQSEFSMNPEIYGYSFDEYGWVHEEQKLDYRMCTDIANSFNRSMLPTTYIADFQMISYLSLGVALEDILKYNQFDLMKHYDIPKLNAEKISQYKTMVGAI
jgi:hypothetical protein